MRKKCVKYKINSSCFLEKFSRDLENIVLTKTVFKFYNAFLYIDYS